MGSTRKPVIVRKLSRDWLAGYAAHEFGDSNAELELLDSSGKVTQIAWSAVKWVCYVKELSFTPGSIVDKENPERLVRRRFTTRPRMEGIWLRLTLVDGEELEGLAANDLSLLGGGLLLTPPDTRSNTQRVFVPRSAIRELTVLGVFTTPGAGRRDSGRGLFKASALDLQPDLFAEQTPSSDGDNIAD